MFLKIVKKLNPEVQNMINAFYAFDEETKSYIWIKF